MKHLRSLNTFLLLWLLAGSAAFAQVKPELIYSQQNKQQEKSEAVKRGNKPEHGGAFISLGDFNVELLAKNEVEDFVDFTAYIKDKKQNLVRKGMLTLLVTEADKKRISVPMAAGNDDAFHARVVLVHRPRYRALVSYKPVGERIVDGTVSVKATGGLAEAHGH